MTTVRDLMQQAGVSGVGGIKAPQNYWFVYTLDFNEDVAAGGTSEKSFTTDPGPQFVVDQINGVAFRSALDGAMLAYTPLMREPSPTEASNTMQALAGLRLELRTTNYNWTRQPVRWPLIVGDARESFYPAMNPVLGPTETLFGKLYNGLLDVVQAQVAFIGRRIAA